MKAPGSSMGLSTDAASMYFELHAASAFSFLEAASLPEALIAQAARYGYPAMALLDRDGVYGAPRFHLAAKKAGLKAIIGAELTVRGARREVRGGRSEAGGGRREARAVFDLSPPEAATAPRASHLAPRASDDTLFRLPVLIESQAGYRNLCRLVTTMRLRSATEK